MLVLPRYRPIDRETLEPKHWEMIRRVRTKLHCGVLGSFPQVPALPIAQARWFEKSMPLVASSAQAVAVPLDIHRSAFLAASQVAALLVVVVPAVAVVHLAGDIAAAAACPSEAVASSLAGALELAVAEAKQFADPEKTSRPQQVAGACPAVDIRFDRKIGAEPESALHKTDNSRTTQALNHPR